MIAHAAANTKRIRVGAGGIMLPNHSPLKVVENFSLLRHYIQPELIWESAERQEQTV